MKKLAIPFLSATALVMGAVCAAQESLAESKQVSAEADDQVAPSDVQMLAEEVIVSISGLYGDWKTAPKQKRRTASGLEESQRK